MIQGSLIVLHNVTYIHWTQTNYLRFFNKATLKIIVIPPKMYEGAQMYFLHPKY